MATNNNASANLSIDLKIPGFEYFMKTCTFDQLSILKDACSGLRELGVIFLPYSAFYEALNIGPDDNRIAESEKEIIFEVVKNKDNKASLYNMEELCDYIETELLKEEQAIKVEKINEELDLDGVQLDFDSSEEDINDYLEDKEHDGSYIDMSKDNSVVGGDAHTLDLTVTDNSMINDERTYEQRENHKLMFLEDAKDVLLQAVGFLTKGIQNVDKIKDMEAYDKKIIEETTQLLAQTTNGITKTCLLIEKVENQRKKNLREREMTQHRINSLELELRNQGDYIVKIKAEYDELQARVAQSQEKEEVISNMTRRIKEVESKFFDERQKLMENLKDVESELEKEKARTSDINSRYQDLKEDMNLVQKLNEKQKMDIVEGSLSIEKMNQLSSENTQLRLELERKSKEIDLQKDKNLDLTLMIKELEISSKREESRANELMGEIDFLQNRIQELEEQYQSDKIEGNAHIGLSKIDFVGMNKLDRTANNSQRNSLYKSQYHQNLASDKSFVIQEASRTDIQEASVQLESSDGFSLMQNSGVGGHSSSKLTFQKSLNNPTEGSDIKLETPSNDGVKYGIAKFGPVETINEQESREDDSKPIPMSIFNSAVKFGNEAFGFESQLVFPPNNKLGMDSMRPSEKDKTELVSRFSVRSSMKTGPLNSQRGKLTVTERDIEMFEEFSLCKDYLNLAADPMLEPTLVKFNDKDIDGSCFSDYIYLFSNKMKRNRVRLLITGKGIYIFTGKKKNSWKVLRTYLIKNLEQITMTTENYTLFLLSFSSGYDLLIDSYRRLDIILYTAQRMKKQKMKVFSLVSIKNFKLKKRDQTEIEINYKKEMKGQLPILQETFRNCKRSGYLKLRRKRLFGYGYSEYFFILSNIGIVYFKTFGTGKTSGFIPFLGAKVRVGYYNELKKHHLLVIEYGKKLKVVLQALSDIDRDGWIEGMHYYQNKAIEPEKSFEKIEKKVKKDGDIFDSRKQSLDFRKKKESSRVSKKNSKKSSKKPRM